MLVEVFAPAPRWIVFGAVDVAAALTRLAAFLGFDVTVCDARPAFATAARFPDAHEVVVDWPHRYLERTTVERRRCSPSSPTTPSSTSPSSRWRCGARRARRGHGVAPHPRERLERLRENGVGEDALARLRSPVGLDLGARTPEETAVSIAAEVVAVRAAGRAGRCATPAGGSTTSRSRPWSRGRGLP